MLKRFSALFLVQDLNFPRYYGDNPPIAESKRHHRDEAFADACRWPGVKAWRFASKSESAIETPRHDPCGYRVGIHGSNSFARRRGWGEYVQ